MRCLWCASHGLRWRNLRRISVTSLFSPWRTASFGEFLKTIGLKVVDEMMEKKGEVKVKMFHFGSLEGATTLEKVFEVMLLGCSDCLGFWVSSFGPRVCYLALGL